MDPRCSRRNITITNAVIECILSRCATKYFDSSVTLSDDQIRELVRIATSAPTSFHLQNWRFIAVRTPEAKARLSPIAWNQPPITDAAVTFIVCGQLADSSVIPERLAPVVEAGIMPAEMVPHWQIPARGLYFEHPQRQRDEAVRTGGLRDPRRRFARTRRATFRHAVPSHPYIGRCARCPLSTDIGFAHG